jgi:hypothetical protein
MRNSRGLWIVLEKTFKVLNSFLNRRGLLLSYSVIDTNPKKAIKVDKNKFIDSAILIQGPILYPAFLDMAIRFYAFSYPEVPIFLSTWKNEGNLRDLKCLSLVNLIENEPPSKSGISNINFQVKSTLSGISHAEDIKSKFLLKIRSDQALFASNFLDQFHQSLSTVPPSKFKRIATTDFNSFLFRPNSPSDQIQFAETGTLMEFWSAYDDSKLVDGTFPEEILLLSYLSKLGVSTSKSLKSSLQIYRDHFTFLDASDLGFFWRKGSWRHPDSRFDQLDRSSLHKFVTPDEWRRLHNNLEYVLLEARELGITNLSDDDLDE